MPAKNLANSLKLILIGLDGASFDVLQPMINAGELPTLSSLVHSGCSGYLTSTIPPYSAPAWATFMTGMNPGKHGVFGFTNYDPVSYSQMESNFVTSKMFAGKTIFDLLSQSGYRLGVISMPVTYPVWPINGFMVAGEPCPDTSKYLAYPDEFAHSLPRRYAFMSSFWSSSNDEIITGLYQMDEARTELAIRLINERNIDVLFIVLGATDRVQHNFWRFYDPEYSASIGLPDLPEYRYTIQETYKRADALVAKLLMNANDETQVFVISDHGGGAAARQLFNTNTWLQEKGFLKVKVHQNQIVSRLSKPAITARKILDSSIGDTLRRWLPEQIIGKGRMIVRNIAQVDWSKTRAYRFPMYPPAEGIVLNVFGRQSEGIVDPGVEYDELRKEIIEKALQLMDPATGSKVVLKAYLKEELYSGIHLDKAPDIILILSDRYAGGTGLSKSIFSEVEPGALEKVNGEHRMDGILIANGSAIRSGVTLTGARLIDVPSTLLFALGETVPENMDGVVLWDLFKLERPERKQAITDLSGWTLNLPVEQEDLTPEEEGQIRRQLQRLGYL